MRAEADAPVIYGSLITGDGLDLSAGSTASRHRQI
jgi:hypothetical protein